MVEQGQGAKQEARSFLGYFKWLFEAAERARLPTDVKEDQVDFEWLMKNL